MYAVTSELKKINGQLVDTFEREIVVGNTVLRAEAGTNGYKGGDRGSGSRTYVCIDWINGDFHFSPVLDDEQKVVGIEIACCGDDGMDALMKAFAFAEKTLNDQILEVND